MLDYAKLGLATSSIVVMPAAEARNDGGMDRSIVVLMSYLLCRLYGERTVAALSTGAAMAGLAAAKMFRSL